MLLQIWLLIEGPTKKNLKSFKNITIKKKKKETKRKGNGKGNSQILHNSQTLKLVELKEDTVPCFAF